MYLFVHYQHAKIYIDGISSFAKPIHKNIGVIGIYDTHQVYSCKKVCKKTLHPTYNIFISNVNKSNFTCMFNAFSYTEKIMFGYITKTVWLDFIEIEIIAVMCKLYR